MPQMMTRIQMDLIRHVIFYYFYLTLLILGGGYRTLPPLADLAVISKGMYQTTPNFLTFTIPLVKSFFMSFAFSFKNY